MNVSSFHSLSSPILPLYLFCLLHLFPIFIIAVLLVGVWVPSLTDPRRCWELHNHRFDCMFLIPCIHWVIRLCWHAICAIFKNWTQFFSHIWYVLVLSFLFILVLTVYWVLYTLTGTMGLLTMHLQMGLIAFVIDKLCNFFDMQISGAVLDGCATCQRKSQLEIKNLAYDCTHSVNSMQCLLGVFSWPAMSSQLQLFHGLFNSWIACIFSCFQVLCYFSCCGLLAL